MAEERNEITSSDVERKLRGLTPKRSSIDRDRLMYLAGQQSVVATRSRGERVWCLATIVSSTATLILAMLLMHGDANAPASRDIARPSVETPPQQPAQQPAQLDFGGNDDAVFAREESEVQESISERGRAMFALRQAVSETGVSVLSEGQPVGTTHSVPSVWDELRTANLREAVVRRPLRGSGWSKGLLGVFELGTKS